MRRKSRRCGRNASQDALVYLRVGREWSPRRSARDAGERGPRVQFPPPEVVGLGDVVPAAAGPRCRVHDVLEELGDGVLDGVDDLGVVVADDGEADHRDVELVSLEVPGFESGVPSRKGVRVRRRPFAASTSCRRSWRRRRCARSPIARRGATRRRRRAPTRPRLSRAGRRAPGRGPRRPWRLRPSRGCAWRCRRGRRPGGRGSPAGARPGPRAGWRPACGSTRSA